MAMLASMSIFVRRSLLAFLLLVVACSTRESEVLVPRTQQDIPVPKPMNHLEGTTSPYLLQHVHNPVDWYPWGEAALERARAEDKPIFLSIGYSACHWCHVMERESFEDAEVAAMLNEHFVCIKVDREERPDLDEIYMAAVVRMNEGRGGWPMSVFLTPDRKPFFAGTYWPKRARGGMPGFVDVLGHCQRLWVEKRDRVLEVGDILTKSLADEAAMHADDEQPGVEVLRKAVEVASERFDAEWGGFGQAPKFPHASELSFLLRFGRRSGDDRSMAMALSTLEHMARGGMYDQVGGGFARYSTDRSWLVPHFEKMLYDNAQLASLYLEAHAASGRDFYLRIAREVLDYVLREMTTEEGGFCSATDADSEGVEGKFFVWSEVEFLDIVTKATSAAMAKELAAFFEVSAGGNFEGHVILTRRRSAEDFAKERGLDVDALRAAIERARAALYEERARRVPPLKDDKVLTSWNGLMLSAFAQGVLRTGNARWLEAARKNARFLLSAMRDDEGRLFRTRRLGRSHIPAFLEDYAALARGLLDLYEVDPSLEWLEAARGLHAQVEARFAVGAAASYYATADDAEALIVRRSSAEESSLPSAQGMAAEVAARLGLLAGEPDLVERARAVLRAHGHGLARYPNAFGQLLRVLDFLEAGPREVYLVGDTSGDFARETRMLWPPYRVLAVVDEATRPRLEVLLAPVQGKHQQDGRPTAYVCVDGTCRAPVTSLAALRAELASAASRAR